MLPMIKLGGLVARTLTKPFARVIKSQSKVHPILNVICYHLGQHQHQVRMKLHLRFRNISTFTIKLLPEDQAVEQGADLIGEIFIFSVALGVASLEYSRSAASTRLKEAKEKEQQLQEEQEMEARFQYLESQVMWLEDQVEKVTRTLETVEIRRLQDDQLIKKQRKDCETSELGQRQQDVHVNFDRQENTHTSSSIVKLWTTTYNAVAGLFK